MRAREVLVSMMQKKWVERLPSESCGPRQNTTPCTLHQTSINFSFDIFYACGARWQKKNTVASPLANINHRRVTFSKVKMRAGRALFPGALFAAHNPRCKKYQHVLTHKCFTFCTKWMKTLWREWEWISIFVIWIVYQINTRLSRQIDLFYLWKRLQIGSPLWIWYND